jgi:hypothetical protein
MHDPAKKLPTRARKETHHLVLSLRPESPRKLIALRSIATSVFVELASLMLDKYFALLFAYLPQDAWCPV